MCLSIVFELLIVVQCGHVPDDLCSTQLQLEFVSPLPVQTRSDLNASITSIETATLDDDSDDEVAGQWETVYVEQSPVQSPARSRQAPEGATDLGYESDSTRPRRKSMSRMIHRKLARPPERPMETPPTALRMALDAS